MRRPTPIKKAPIIPSLLLSIRSFLLRQNDCADTRARLLKSRAIEHQAGDVPAFFILVVILQLFTGLDILFPKEAKATGMTYYIANAGNDSCNGTSQTIGTSGNCAWKTIAKVNASSFLPGDSILFNRGNTWQEQIIVHASGSSGNPITFGAYGTGANPVIIGTQSAAVITINGKNFITLQDLDLTKGLYGLNAGGGTKDLTVLNCNASYNVQDGFFVHDPGSDRAKFINVTAHDNMGSGTNGGAGINIYSPDGGSIDGAFVSGGTFYNHTVTYGGGVTMTRVTNSTISGVESYNNFYGLKVAAGATGVLLTGNLVHDNDNFGIDMDTGIVSSIVEKNLVYNNGSHGIAIEGELGGRLTSRITTRYNVIHDNNKYGTRYGILVASSTDSDISYNIIYNQDEGIDLTYGSTGNNIYNNVIYNTPGGGIVVWTDSTNVTVKNNIIYSNSTYLIYVIASATSGFVSDYNQFYGTGAVFRWGTTGYNFANWKTASGQDAHSINSDPRFRNAAAADFTLQSTSPAIDAGVSLGDTYKNAITPGSSWPSSVTTSAQDLNGSGWEMGAYVYSILNAPTPAAPTGLRVTTGP